MTMGYNRITLAKNSSFLFTGLKGLKGRLALSKIGLAGLVFCAHTVFFIGSARSEITVWSPPDTETRTLGSKPKRALLGAIKPKKDPNDKNPAFTAFLHGEYLTALAEARKAAARKEPSAYTLIGHIYEKGLGVARNDNEAFKWYLKAAKRGDVNALFAAAIMYNAGRGTKADKSKAAVLFEKAAQKGHAAAQYNLAMIYVHGIVVDENYKEAARWLKKSADQSNAQAQFELGTLYKYGKGVPKDQKKAEYWIKKAALSGLINAELEYAIMVFNKYKPQKQILRKQIGQIKDVKILSGLRALPEQKRLEKIKTVGSIKRLKGDQQRKAIKHYAQMLETMWENIPVTIRKKSNEERFFAMKRVEKKLAEIKLLDQKNYPIAFSFFASAAQKGNPIAQNRLARLYAYGIATPPNLIEAAKWHLLAKRNGLADMKLDAFVKRLTGTEKRQVYKMVDEWESLSILN